MEFKGIFPFILVFFSLASTASLDGMSSLYADYRLPIVNQIGNRKELRMLNDIRNYNIKPRSMLNNHLSLDNNQFLYTNELINIVNETRPIITYTEIKPLLERTEKDTVLEDGNTGYTYKNPKAEKLFNLMVPPKKIQGSNNLRGSNIRKKKPKNNIRIPNVSKIVNSFYEPPDPDPISENSNDREKKPKAFSLLPYLGVFIPTISLSIYTSIFTFFVEILSRKYYFFKKLLLIILPVVLAIEIFETISFWIMKSLEISWMFVVGTTIELIFIVELLIHILPLFGLWDIKSGRRMKFYWIHIPMLFIASFIYAIHVSKWVFSYGTFVLFFAFLFPLTVTYAFNLELTEVWYRKLVRKFFTKGDKSKEELLNDEDEIEFNKECLVLECSSDNKQTIEEVPVSIKEGLLYESNLQNTKEVDPNLTVCKEGTYNMRERLKNLSKFVI